MVELRDIVSVPLPQFGVQLLGRVVAVGEFPDAGRLIKVETPGGDWVGPSWMARVVRPAEVQRALVPVGERSER